MNTKDELKKLLRRINSAEDVEKIKPEIKKKLRGINPTELSRAEQELAEAEDIGVEEIRNLCGPHLEILEEENLEGNQEETQEREEGHPRSVLEGEHEVLLEKLDELSEDERAEGEQAANGCPVFAIELLDKETGETLAP